MTPTTWYVQEILSSSGFWLRRRTESTKTVESGFSELNCSAAQTRFLTVSSCQSLWNLDHTRSSLWMPSDLFKLSLQGGRVGVCVCSRGYPLSGPSKRQKNTSVGLPKTVKNQTSHLASSLLLFILLLLPTYGRSYFASSWGIKKRVSGGQRGRNGDAYQSAMNAHHKGPLFSHNCPPTFITWKNKQQGLP